MCTELCDDEDNDGDGRIDEGGVEDGAPCESNLMGLCSQGFTRCVEGELTCEPRTEPMSETCNEIDDDCDGRVDEFAADLNRCGDCGPAPLELAMGSTKTVMVALTTTRRAKLDGSVRGTCASPVPQENVLVEVVVSMAIALSMRAQKVMFVRMTAHVRLGSVQR